MQTINFLQGVFTEKECPSQCHMGTVLPCPILEMRGVTCVDTRATRTLSNRQISKSCHPVYITHP